MKKHQLILSFVLIAIAGSLSAQNENSSSIFSLSRFRFGIYAMPHIVSSSNPKFPEHTKDHTKILGWGITNGLQVEYKFTDRRALRTGILLSEERGNYQLLPDDPWIAYSVSAVYGSSYFLKRNEYYLQFPIAYKYSFIKSSRKTKLNPYILAGLSFVYIYKRQSIYLNNGSLVTNHTEVDNTFNSLFPYIILTVGLDYAITEHLHLYAEPFYNRTEPDCLGYYYFDDFKNNGFDYWGIGMGINYHF